MGGKYANIIMWFVLAASGLVSFGNCDRSRAAANEIQKVACARSCGNERGGFV